VDASGYSILVGVALKPNMTSEKYGQSMLAPFFEAGWGGYNSYNNFSGNAVNANGNVSYYGGGLMLKHDFPVGLYLEASARAGEVLTSYRSGDLRDASGHAASYDTTAAYFGAHGGAGWVWNITERASLDVFGKYI